MSEKNRDEIEEDKLLADQLFQRFNVASYLRMVHAREGVFVYNRYDNSVGKSLELYGEWSPKAIAFLTSLLVEGDFVIDVGAYIGTHTVPFAKKVGMNGRVISFEPQRFNYNNLCTNIFLNGLLNVISFSCVVGKSQATMLVPVLSPDQDLNFGAVKIKQFKKGEEVRIIPLDDLQLPRCKLIKIDVEGMESEVLEGAVHFIERFKPYLFVENNTVEGSELILRTLKFLNYRCYWTFETYFNPNNFFGNPVDFFESYTEADLFCVHKSSALEMPLLEPVQGTDDNWIKAIKRKYPDFPYTGI